MYDRVEGGMKQLWARALLYTFLSVYGFMAGAAFMTVEEGDLLTIVVGTWEIGAREFVAIPTVCVFFMPFALAVLTMGEL